MPIVWLVFDNRFLLGVYLDRVDADEAAKQIRDRVVAERGEGAKYSVWAEACAVTASPTRRPDPRETHLDAIDKIADQWGLHTLAELGTAHFFHVGTYVAVAHDDVRKFPGYQFTMARTLYPGFREALAVFRNNGWDDRSIALWFASRQGAANGAIPAYLLRSDPDAVVEAAHAASHG